MIEVVPVGADRFADVAPLFDLMHNSALTPADWRRLFDYAWPCDTPDRGFALTDAGRVVGFFGTLWSEREIRGTRHRFCNLSTWVTHPEYRHHSLRLFQAVLGLKDCTLTCHTPAGKLHALYRKFGFQDLETKLRLLPLLPPLSALLPLTRWRVTRDPEKIAAHLSGRDRTIFEHHRAMRCGHLLVHAGAEYCHVLHTRLQGRRASFAHIHYISHPDVFVRALGAVRRGLLWSTRTPLVVLPARLAEGLPLRGGRDVPLATPQVFRSATLAARDIDNLYSEVLLFGL